MKLNDMFPGNFLKKEDVPQPVRATIKNVTQEEIKGDGGNEMKNVVNFTGDMKPMVLNKGNAVTLAETFGDDSDTWHGKTVEIYTDPSVMFGGKRVGGLRIRVPAPGGAHGPAADLWDVSDGQTVMQRQTTEQVQVFLSDLKVPLESVKVKPSGADRSTAKTADKWIEGAAPASKDDPIPF